MVGATSWPRDRAHHSLSADPSDRGHEQVDDLDADERDDDAAQAVDERGCAAAGRPPRRPVADASQCQRTSAMMISALKITAERIADCGCRAP